MPIVTDHTFNARVEAWPEADWRLTDGQGPQFWLEMGDFDRGLKLMQAVDAFRVVREPC